MKTVFAVQLYRDTSHDLCRWFDNALTMTIVLARSLRGVGETCDIAVLTNDLESCDLLRREGLMVTERKYFNYPILEELGDRACKLSRLDMQKIYYWDLTDYDRVIGLDSDILAISKFQEWERTGVNCVVLDGKRFVGINSGSILLEPSTATFDDMYQIVQTSTFSFESGWNNCGPLPGINRWNFQSAEAAQGFIPYYFIPKGKYHALGWGKYLIHYAGVAKFKDPDYLRAIRHSGLPFQPPAGVSL